MQNKQTQVPTHKATHKRNNKEKDESVEITHMKEISLDKLNNQNKNKK